MSNKNYIKRALKQTNPEPDLFETPIRSKQVRKGVVAYQYRNGIINIDGIKYAMHSMTSAINAHRKLFPAK